MKRARLWASLCLVACSLVASQAFAQPATQPQTQPAGRGGGRGAAAAPVDFFPEDIQTLAGFKVEVVHKADRTANGSWISMAKDNRGRLLLGGQRGHAVTRITLRSGRVAKEEILRLPVSEVMGMLEVGDALYVNASGRSNDARNVYGLFRLRDPKGDASFSEVEFLREWPRGSGEHGAHALLMAPDKQHIYAVLGNQVPQPTDVSELSPLRNYKDDRAIPRHEDTFMANEPPPGGSIVRLDFDGRNPVAVAGGQRNTYDAAFNADGEIFGYDSDMEWDWGLPWYRPTRVFHATSGADQGYRGGSGKLPTYYEDTLPQVVDIGLGSPTGVTFGYGAKFPAKYQKALYILDWTYGRLIAVHLKPRGAGYEATWENFVAPKSLHSLRKVPLNLTDAVIGDDGAMYFTVGGRNTQACLFRVSYVGDEGTAPVDPRDKDGAEARSLRRKLEAFHGTSDPTAVSTAWPHLGSDDRYIRYAARVAVESRPVAEWKIRALTEPNPQAAIEALIALARVGGQESNADVLKGLLSIPLGSMNEDLQLQWLRCVQIAISRNGKPAPELAEKLVAELNPYFPSYSQQLNNELSQILLVLEAPDAIGKTIRLMQAANTQEEQVAYVLYLRQITVGWTPELRSEFFTWFNAERPAGLRRELLQRWFSEAGRAYANGNSFNGFISRLRTEAVATLSAEESQSLAPILTTYRPPPGRGRGAGGGGGGAGGRGGPATAPATAPSPGVVTNSVPTVPNPPPVTIAAALAPPAAAIEAAVAAPGAAQRSVVKEWKMEDLEPSLSEINSGRNFQRGRLAYLATQCAACHAIAGTPATGGVGPDLTSIASRFRRRDILEAIVEPSKVISEQFADTLIRTKAGAINAGRVLTDTDDVLVIQPNPLAPDKVEYKKADIEARRLSPTSPMPTGLINVLSKDEVLDLMAYVESGARPDHPDFSK